jgi:hypothetical protein
VLNGTRLSVEFVLELLAAGWDQSAYVRICPRRADLCSGDVSAGTVLFVAADRHNGMSERYLANYMTAGGSLYIMQNLKNLGGG